MSKTPEDWVSDLSKELDAVWREISIYDDYFEGRHRLAYATERFREVFGYLFGAFADNWCPIIVQAPVERMEITGFRAGSNEPQESGNAAPDLAADQDAWRIWQANNLDAGSAILHAEAIKLSQAFTLVDPVGPRITIEHPSQVIVRHAAGDRTKRLAALKRWLGDDGYAYANVYLPEAVVKFRSEREAKNYGGGATRIRWERRTDDPGGVNPLGVVPVVPFYNDPTMLGKGSSDLKVALPLQDAINKFVLDMVVASEFAAVPQRAVIGWDPPRDPETDQVLPGVGAQAMIERMLTFKDPNVKLTQFQAADLGNYIKPVETLIQHLAAQTRTPPHYLLASMVNVSGDALAAAESGLVSRTKKKIRDFSESWEETMRLAFLAKGDRKRGTATDMVTIWADVERQSFAQLIDGAVKMRSGLGLPMATTLQKIGYSQQEIKTIAKQAERPDPSTTSADLAAVGG